MLLVQKTLKRLKYRHQQRIVDNYNDIGRVALISRDAFTNLAGFRFGGSLGRGMVSGILWESFGQPPGNEIQWEDLYSILFVFGNFVSCKNTIPKKDQKWRKPYRVRHICNTATSLQIHCLPSPLEMWFDSKIASLQVRDLTDRAHGDRGDMVALQTVSVFFGHENQGFVVRKTWKQDKQLCFSENLQEHFPTHHLSSKWVFRVLSWKYWTS